MFKFIFSFFTLINSVCSLEVNSTYMYKYLDNMYKSKKKEIDLLVNIYIFMECYSSIYQFIRI